MSGRQFDAIVVGAGIVGTSIAFRLAERGRSVAIIEAGAPGSGVSGQSFAWLNSEQKHPDSYHRLNAAGMAEYRALTCDVPGVHVHQVGALRWAEDEHADAQLEQRRARLAGLGSAAEWIARGEAERLEPHVRFPAAAERLLFYADQGWVDPPQVIRALLDAAGDAITLVEGAPVEAIEHTGSRVSGVRARGLTFECESLVIAAGAGSPALIELIGGAAPVRRSPGLVIVTAPVPPATIGRVLLPPHADVRPDSSGGVRISTATSAIDGGDRDAPALHVDDVLAQTVELVPALAGALVARVLLGVRPIPEDGVTIAGRVPGVENAWVAVTHSGVTLGPLLGRLIASEVAGAEPDALLAKFGPDRFA